MKHDEAPQQHRETRVRALVRQAEQVRYWWEYRGRLKAMLRVIDANGTVQLTAAERASVSEFWAGHGVSRVNTDWYRVFKALNGTVDVRYIPEEIFRVQLEPLLCRRDVSAAYHDKNQLDRLFPDLRRPRTILRNIYGSYLTGDYEPIARADVPRYLAGRNGAHILKPAISGTGSGANVARIELTSEGIALSAMTWTLDDIERVYVQDFVIQEQAGQHESMRQFHPPSLNTVRVISLRFDGTIHVVAATLRMGNGSHVDNGHAGGLLCGVDLASGRITTFAFDVLFRRFDRHPRSSIVFAGQTVPSFTALTAAAQSVHQRLAYFDVVSCDLAVLPDGDACVVEVNTFGQGVEPHQVLKGQPLFGEHTDRVLQLIAARRRSGWNR
jgi:hypothetical protein